MKPDAKLLKSQEQIEHNKTYKHLSGSQLRVYSVEAYRQEVGTPAYEDNSALSGDINAVFLKRVAEILCHYDPETVRILDYGCGMGKMSVFLALQGFKHIEGFDLSEEGIAFGVKLAELSGVSDRITLRTMDAEKLDFPDDYFDIVIGKAVLHHTIKYSRSGPEIIRILKKGGRVIFKENLGNNPIFKIARFFTMQVFGRQGDVNITTPMLRRYTQGFSLVNVEAWNFLYMAKRLLW